MNKRRFSGLVAVLLLGLTGVTPAQAQESSAAVGQWVGQVSWSTRPVFYSWQINSDATFSSGREGRGHDGGGVWRADGARLTLKYSDGFRYEGEVRGDAYSGTAYLANGSPFGSFGMSRVLKRSGDSDPDA